MLDDSVFLVALARAWEVRAAQPVQRMHDQQLGFEHGPELNFGKPGKPQLTEGKNNVHLQALGGMPLHIGSGINPVREVVYHGYRRIRLIVTPNAGFKHTCELAIGEELRTQAGFYFNASGELHVYAQLVSGHSHDGDANGGGRTKAANAVGDRPVTGAIRRTTSTVPSASLALTVPQGIAFRRTNGHGTIIIRPETFTG